MDRADINISVQSDTMLRLVDENMVLKIILLRFKDRNMKRIHLPRRQFQEKQLQTDLHQVHMTDGRCLY